MKPTGRPSARAAALALAALVLTVPIVAAGDEVRAPTPVVERTLDVEGRHVRTTLFSNGVVVVSVRRDGERIFFRQVELDQVEYLGYLAALQRDADELANADSLPEARGSGGLGTVTLHVGPEAPLIFGYSSMEVYDLTTTRLLGTLDDLEYQVLFREPTGAGIEGWEPAPGDVVALRTGHRATVVEVGRDGTLILEHDVTHIREIVPAGQRKQVIYEVVDEP